MPSPLVITAEQLEAIFEYRALTDWLEERHCEPRAALDDVYMEQATAGTTTGFLVRPAWAAGAALGVKLATVFPGNPADGLPTVHGVYVLFDGRDGRPVAIMDGTVLTWFKTACDSALGSRRLARPDSASMLMVGAGAMAPHLIRAHLAAIPGLEKVTIWNRTASRAAQLANSLEGEVDVAVTPDLEEAVRAADLISCATMAEGPLIRGGWLGAGSHVDLVGAYTPGMRETDDETMARGRIFVDSRETTVEVIGELMAPIEAGVITPDDIVGDLYDLCSGSVSGRTSPDEITVFKNGGGGHLDLMTAQFVSARLG